VTVNSNAGLGVAVMERGQASFTANRSAATGRMEGQPRIGYGFNGTDRDVIPYP
jgi:hypothetical protein